jgi:argininosuccinate synthase
LWGTSVGGKETLTSHQALPSEAYPSQLVRGRRKVTLEFEKENCCKWHKDKPSALLLLKTG